MSSSGAQLGAKDSASNGATDWNQAVVLFFRAMYWLTMKDSVKW